MFSILDWIHEHQFKSKHTNNTTQRNDFVSKSPVGLSPHILPPIFYILRWTFRIQAFRAAMLYERRVSCTWCFVTRSFKTLDIRFSPSILHYSSTLLILLLLEILTPRCYPLSIYFVGILQQNYLANFFNNFFNFKLLVITLRSGS